MIRSNRNSRHDRPGYQSRSAGDDLITELGDLVAAYHVESSRWPDLKALRIWESAWTLDRIRIDLISGRISVQDAQEWLYAGRTILNETIRDRCTRDHPAGKQPT